MIVRSRVFILVCLTLAPAQLPASEPPKDPAPPTVPAGYSIRLIDLASQYV
jgi:hypothetical protein